MPDTETKETKSDLLATLYELKGHSMRNLLLLTIASTLCWYVWKGIATPPQYAPDRGLFIVPILMMEYLCFTLLRRRQRGVVVLYLVSGLAFTTAGALLFRSPQAMFLYSILALAAVVVSGPLAGMGMAAAGTLSAYLLTTHGSQGWGQSSQVIIVGLSSFGTVLVGWMLSRNFQLAVQWSLTSYQEARTNLLAIRDRRAEVIHLNQELRRARERLERANVALLRTWRAAEEAERRQKQMTAFISHELRTPLNLVIGFSELLATSPETYALGALPPKARRDINAIYRSAQQVAALVDDVLDMASVDQGHLALMREPSDLWRVIVEAAALIRDYVEAKGLELGLSKENDLPTLLIDRLRLRQVLLNLLVNAARFTEKGSITVRALAEPSGVRVMVTDTGRGLLPERLETIFRSFQSTESADSSWKKGTGLGLPLSRQLVHLHGGEMGVESEMGKGSTFWFTLPLETSAAEEMPTTLTKPSPRTERRSALEPSVVVLDEDETSIRRLSRWLEGYHLVSAGTWAEANRQADAFRALAIVTDHDATTPQGTRLPVVRCPLPSPRRWAERLGVEAYLTKPIKADQLVQTVERITPGARSILVVDDDEQFVRLVTRFLESSDRSYELYTAYNGEEALQRLREALPDVLLLDLVLPKLDGRQVLEQKIRDPMIAPIPVIVISAPPVEDEMAPLGTLFSLEQRSGLRLPQVIRLLETMLAALSLGGTIPAPSGRAPLATGAG